MGDKSDWNFARWESNWVGGEISKEFDEVVNQIELGIKFEGNFVSWGVKLRWGLNLDGIL